MGPFFSWNLSQSIWEIGTGARASFSSSGSFLQKDPVQKPAGPSCVPPGVPNQDFSGQFPEPSLVPLFPFQSRVDTWTEGLVARGFDRDVAVLATKSNKPSTRRQFQSGWKQRGTLQGTIIGSKMFQGLHLPTLWAGSLLMKALHPVLF